MSGVRRIVREYGVWAGVALGITLVVAAATGWWLLLVYGVVNAAGSVLYLDGLDRRTQSTRWRRRWLPVMTVLQLPVGLLGVLASKGGTDPIDGSIGHEDIRNAVPGANLYGHGRGHPFT